MGKGSSSAKVLMPKRGQRGARDLCSKREKKEKKQGVWKEQPTCYHTVFNNSVAATRGLHVHATAVQCLLSVCATHEKAAIQKSKHSALSVSSRLEGCRSSLCLRIEVFPGLIDPERGPGPQPPQLNTPKAPPTSDSLDSHFYPAPSSSVALLFCPWGVLAASFTPSSYAYLSTLATSWP